MASNLAVVLAQSMRKTILVDADMRRPTIHQIMRLSNQRGLSSLFVLDTLYQQNGDQPDGTIQTTKIDSLSVVASGKEPPNPSDLLGSERMNSIIYNLEELADIIVIDSPPVLVVTDAVSLSPRVDAVLLVIRPGQTKFEAARQSIEQLRRMGANVVGVVLNNVTTDSHSYGYGGHYYRYNAEYYGKQVEKSPLTRPKRDVAWLWRNGWGRIGLGGLMAVILAVIGFGAFSRKGSTIGEDAVIANGSTLETERIQTEQVEVILVDEETSVLKDTRTPSLGVTTTLSATELPTLTVTPIPTPSSTLTQISTDLPTETVVPKIELVLHEVLSGESVPLIANNYETSSEVLRYVNQIVASIDIGDVLVIFPGQTDLAKVSPLSVTQVEEAILVDDLSVELGVKNIDLLHLNGLEPGEEIAPGTWIIYPSLNE